jgi:preprotein translocase subunit Sec61beta
MRFGWRFLAGVAAALAALLGVSACGGGLVKYYEYDEDIYLSIDGSATIYVNASVPALVNLRGLDLDVRSTAILDRAKIRRLFTTGATRVTRVSRWRRFGRQFVQVRMAVDDVRKLGSTAPFSWATYELDRRDGLVVYRQRLGAAAGTPVGDVGWKGSELVAVRVHLPSRIQYHNAGAGNLKRGNILVWEQALTDRQAGTPLEIEARIEQRSILYSTLMLFAASGLLALLAMAAIIWWVVRKGRRAAEARRP